MSGLLEWVKLEEVLDKIKSLIGKSRQSRLFSFILIFIPHLVNKIAKKVRRIDGKDQRKCDVHDPRDLKAREIDVTATVICALAQRDRLDIHNEVEIQSTHNCGENAEDA